MAFTKLQQFTSIEEALISLFGNNVKIARMDRISGGDINKAYGLTLTDGTHIFMKENAKENADFFIAEAAGLTAIAQTKTIAVPHILCSGTDRERGSSFLLLEFITAKKRVADYWETLAYELAAMHRAETKDFVTEGSYGFNYNNYIGAKAQVNTAYSSWIDFFRDCRLKPQFQRAAGYFDTGDKKKIDRLLEHMDRILIEPQYPSLLHGDLWSGNVITGNDGRAWLIDPAAYVGHAEADIAMTELFGGFSPVFYEAYKEAADMQPDYRYRRDFYNLYQLLNHLNMFGRSYFPSVKRIIEEYS